MENLGDLRILGFLEKLGAYEREMIAGKRRRRKGNERRENGEEKDG